MQSAISYAALGQFTKNRQVFSPKSIIRYQPVEEYLRWKASYSKSAHKAYRIWVERFQKFVGKNPEELILQDVTEFSRAIQGQYASKNIQYGMNIVHNYLRFFHEQGRLNFPLYFVRVPRATANSHRALTEQEYLGMLNALEKQRPLPVRNLSIIRLLYDTGMRVGELCSLNVGDIDKDNSAIISTEKTTKKRRIFWGADTDAVLRRYLSLRLGLDRNQESEKALFMGSRGACGGRITARSIQRITKAVMRISDIQTKISPHSFRHSFIHRLAKQKVPDAVIALLVGHSTTHTVADYTKLSRTELEETYRQALAGN